MILCSFEYPQMMKTIETCKQFQFIDKNGRYMDHDTALQFGATESMISWEVMYGNRDNQDVTKLKQFLMNKSSCL